MNDFINFYEPQIVYIDNQIITKIKIWTVLKLFALDWMIVIFNIDERKKQNRVSKTKKRNKKVLCWDKQGDGNINSQKNGIRSITSQFHKKTKFKKRKLKVCILLIYC